MVTEVKLAIPDDPDHQKSKLKESKPNVAIIETFIHLEQKNGDYPLKTKNWSHQCNSLLWDEGLDKSTNVQVNCQTHLGW